MSSLRVPAHELLVRMLYASIWAHTVTLRHHLLPYFMYANSEGSSEPSLLAYVISTEMSKHSV